MVVRRDFRSALSFLEILVQLESEPLFSNFELVMYTFVWQTSPFFSKSIFKIFDFRHSMKHRCLHPKLNYGGYLSRSKNRHFSLWALPPLRKKLRGVLKSDKNDHFSLKMCHFLSFFGTFSVKSGHFCPT